MTIQLDKAYWDSLKQKIEKVECPKIKKALAKIAEAFTISRALAKPLDPFGGESRKFMDPGATDEVLEARIISEQFSFLQNLDFQDEEVVKWVFCRAQGTTLGKLTKLALLLEMSDILKVIIIDIPNYLKNTYGAEAMQREPNINDEGAILLFEALKNNKSLKVLKLPANAITDEAIKVLAEALKVNTTLQCLDLRLNAITDLGLSLLGDALKINTTLRFINLDYNNITKLGIDEFAKILLVNKNLTTIYDRLPIETNCSNWEQELNPLILERSW